MEGVVDWVLRDFYTREFGADVCVTEFIRVTDRLLPRHVILDQAPELAAGPLCGRTRSGAPVLVQFLGGKAQPMAENAVLAVEMGALGIDLNFGCPARTVNRHDGGAALLKNPERVHEVVSAVRRAVPSTVSVSAKVRLGFSDKSLFLEIAQAAEAGGASWLTVHARTRDEMYRPPAHWQYTAWIREALKIPVIGNGDIWTPSDLERCRAVTGCETLMLGRGWIADPWLGLKARGASIAPLVDEADLLWRFAQATASYRGEHYAICRSKQWCKQLARYSPWSAAAFEWLKHATNLADLERGLHCLSSVRADISCGREKNSDATASSSPVLLARVERA